MKLVYTARCPAGLFAKPPHRDLAIAGHDDVVWNDPGVGLPSAMGSPIRVSAQPYPIAAALRCCPEESHAAEILLPVFDPADPRIEGGERQGKTRVPTGDKAEISKTGEGTYIFRH